MSISESDSESNRRFCAASDPVVTIVTNRDLDPKPRLRSPVVEVVRDCSASKGRLVVDVWRFTMMLPRLSILGRPVVEVWRDTPTKMKMFYEC